MLPQTHHVASVEFLKWDNKLLGIQLVSSDDMILLSFLGEVNAKPDRDTIQLEEGERIVAAKVGVGGQSTINI